jgi:hypothetical protein
MAMTAEVVDRESADFHVLVSELTGQHPVDVSVELEATCDELLDKLSIDLDLPMTDSDGLPQNWSLVDLTESRRVLPGEVISQTVNEGDELQLVPEVAAGRG